MTYPMFFFFNDTATTEIYTLSLHDALPISSSEIEVYGPMNASAMRARLPITTGPRIRQRSRTAPSSTRSEEHTSELQSLAYLVCRLLLEKKNSKLFN